jgi:hypothetical protein
MRKVYSGAGASPRIGPLPMSRGRRYRAPFPCGGTCKRNAWHASDRWSAPARGGAGRANSRTYARTQRLLARTVCLTAWTNCSTDGAGMHMRSAPRCIRRAFSSGRNSVYPARSGRRYAFIPSNRPCRERAAVGRSSSQACVPIIC